MIIAAKNQTGAEQRQQENGDGRKDRKDGRSPTGKNRQDGRGDSRDRHGGQSSGQTVRQDSFSDCGSKPIVPKKESVPWVVPRHYLVPRKVITKSLEILDSKDAPDQPGMMFETTLRDMVARFDQCFGPSNGEKRATQIAGVMDHLHRHTRRRRGEYMLSKGYLEWEQTSKIYELWCAELNVFERIFFTVDIGESSAVFSKFVSFFLIFMIMLSIGAWMFSTLPSVQDIPDGCSSTKVDDCEPEPHKFFDITEKVCVITFTLEYVVRLFTVHSVRFALLDEQFTEAVLTGADMSDLGRDEAAQDQRAVKQPQKVTPADEAPRPPKKLDSKLKTTFLHVTSFANVIDLLAIIPFWLKTFGVEGGGSFLVVLRILRLTRIFRVFKLGKYNEVFTLFTRVVKQSTPALLLMVFFICLGCCLFGTLVWFAEQGTWHPEGNPKLAELNIKGRGAWLRYTGGKDDDLEESPFQSIIHSFWFVIVTITTVGYGDMSPTTLEGKIVTSTAILNGIIVLAMPIGVVGANFSTEYDRVLEDKKRRQRLKEQLETQAMIEAQQDAALSVGDDFVVADALAVSEVATELNRVDVARQRIITNAEALDKIWDDVLPELMYLELSTNLREFVQQFLGADEQESSAAVTKPKLNATRFVKLDNLTNRVCNAIATVTSADVTAEFGLSEAHDCRRKWFQFADDCWEYATKMCYVETRQQPPEYYQMELGLKSRIAGTVAILAGETVNPQAASQSAPEITGPEPPKSQGTVVSSSFPGITGSATEPLVENRADPP